MELRLQNLSKRYPNGPQALQGVTLTVGPGLFGLLGPNGAGKSTLMRTLATLQEADSGSAFLGDIDVLRDKQPPDSSFSPAEPDLEDACFAITQGERP